MRCKSLPHKAARDLSTWLSSYFPQRLWISGRAGFRACRDVVGVVPAEDVPGRVTLVAALGMHRNEDAPLADLGVVALGLEFRDAHADQGADDAPGGGPDRRAAEGGHDRSRGDDRAIAGDGPPADASNQAEPGTQHQADDTSRGRTFRRLGVMFVSENAG